MIHFVAQVQTRQDLQTGDKVALQDMAVGDTVLQCGMGSGGVVAPIKTGEHAHDQAPVIRLMQK